MGFWARRKTKRMVCPCCGGHVEAIPITFGYPTPEAEERQRRGEVLHLGCMPVPWRWACPDCYSPIPSADDRWDLVARPGQDPEAARREWESYRH